MTNPKTIAIIGAGIAGLSCARHLQEAGFQSRVFEKSRGPGGRMSTRRGEDWQCDHGAQYFTVRDPAFRAEVEHWQAAGAARPWHPQIAILGNPDTAPPEAALERWVGFPRMTAPARELARTLNIHLETTVTGLACEGLQWHIETRESGRLTPSFDAVVLAVPAPQAFPLLKPVASELADLVAHARLSGSWALMVRYPAPLRLPFEAAFVNQGPLRWIARNNSKPGRSGEETWLLHATAKWSEAHIEAPPEHVAGVLLAAFTEHGAPPPAAWSAHRWRYADPAPALMAQSLWDEGRCLGVCGDWLNGGQVEGAWLSGRQLATAMARTLRQG